MLLERSEEVYNSTTSTENHAVSKRGGLLGGLFGGGGNGNNNAGSLASALKVQVDLDLEVCLCVHANVNLGKLSLLYILYNHQLIIRRLCRQHSRGWTRSGRKGRRTSLHPCQGQPRSRLPAQRFRRSARETAPQHQAHSHTYRREASVLSTLLS